LATPLVLIWPCACVMIWGSLRLERNLRLRSFWPIIGAELDWPKLRRDGRF
jgi:hypothetical protein